MVIQEKISKELIASMPVAVFPGRIHVVDSTAEVASIMPFLAAQKRVGMDTETKPSFQKWQVHKVALLQISTLEECFLFRLNRIESPQLLVDFLEDPHIEKVGLSLGDDAMSLHRRFPFTPGGWIDLQNEVGALGIQDQSLQKIYANLFAERITKGQRLSNWEASELTPSQQAYAALDAYACLRIYNLMQELKQSGNYVLQRQPRPEADAVLSSCESLNHQSVI